MEALFSHILLQVSRFRDQQKETEIEADQETQRQREAESKTRQKDRNRQEAGMMETGRQGWPAADPGSRGHCSHLEGGTRRGNAVAPSGLCSASAPVYLHGPEIQEFLRAASGAISGQQMFGSGPGCGITLGPPQGHQPPQPEQRQM